MQSFRFIANFKSECLRLMCVYIAFIQKLFFQIFVFLLLQFFHLWFWIIRWYWFLFWIENMNFALSFRFFLHFLLFFPSKNWWIRFRWTDLMDIHWCIIYVKFWTRSSMTTVLVITADVFFSSSLSLSLLLFVKRSFGDGLCIDLWILSKEKKNRYIVNKTCAVPFNHLAVGLQSSASHNLFIIVRALFMNRLPLFHSSSYGIDMVNGKKTIDKKKKCFKNECSIGAVACIKYGSCWSSRYSYTLDGFCQLRIREKEMIIGRNAGCSKQKIETKKNP